MSRPRDNNSSDSGAGGRFRGTSVARPHVAGFAALLRQKYPSLNAGGLRDKLLASVRARVPHPNNLYGFGEIDASRIADGPSDSVLDRLRAGLGEVGALRGCS